MARMHWYELSAITWMLTATCLKRAGRTKSATGSKSTPSAWTRTKSTEQASRTMAERKSKTCATSGSRRRMHNGTKRSTRALPSMSACSRCNALMRLPQSPRWSDKARCTASNSFASSRSPVHRTCLMSLDGRRSNAGAASPEARDAPAAARRGGPPGRRPPEELEAPLTASAAVTWALPPPPSPAEVADAMPLGCCTCR
mmetsp:Transcript_57439/g.126136  ORF Transcript_57439/g.126136 Transcript_57439/m.126136 type:complete len:200 (-) Transcript_57439:325-924(-)